MIEILYIYWERKFSYAKEIWLLTIKIFMWLVIEIIALNLAFQLFIPFIISNFLPT